MDKEIFNNKYRVDTARLKYWDYSADGYYFVTICTKNKINYLGEIVDGKMHLNNVGYIAKKYWQEIPNHYKHMKLDSFIIMPNHIHGILKIINNPILCNCVLKRGIETHDCASLQRRNCTESKLYNNKFGPQSKNIAAAIRAFKSSVKKFTNDHNFEFYWQSRYYDHIIRDETSLFNIRQYIKNNPEKWESDRNNAKNID